MGTRVLDTGDWYPQSTLHLLHLTFAQLLARCVAMTNCIGVVSETEWVSSDGDANQTRLKGRRRVYRLNMPSMTQVGPQLRSSFYNPTVQAVPTPVHCHQMPVTVSLSFSCLISRIH